MCRTVVVPAPAASACRAGTLAVRCASRKWIESTRGSFALRLPPVQVRAARLLQGLWRALRRWHSPCARPRTLAMWPCCQWASPRQGHLAAVPEKIRCCVPVLITYTGCQHQVTVGCHKATARRAQCTQICGQQLTCGHGCAEACGSCSTHRKKQEAVCRQTCGKELLCGHTCHLECHDASTLCDCKQPCIQRCTHSVCNKRCGQACTPCAVECRWTCEHQGPCHMP